MCEFFHDFKLFLSLKNDYNTNIMFFFELGVFYFILYLLV